MGLSAEDLAELAAAKALLETPGLAAKAANVLGRPIERGFDLLPAGWRDKLGQATREALLAALKGALLTMQPQSAAASSPRWHKLAATVSGAAGGAFGLPALIIELPVSTTIICRSIADIARANGEALDTLPAKLACIEVFALGGPSKGDDASETGYFAMRSALARAVSDAGGHLLRHAMLQDGAPALLRLISVVAARFNVQVSEKAAAQAVPVIGAAGGALINLLFIDHFQDISRGHFTVRRLERRHGEAAVREAYLAL
ncbi:EcsC family protein [Aquincola sp. S2]|uniref:EcsC family protein n=1 Tax=Pseudaquabacterium terrae TaxID=2732868 RepID=A0ABX2EBV4_9BURK|nr:EcsC family protein [Aquabacterium terrae]NRF66026.1 EcsC family protein [Aquabacterium terrae]